MPKFNQYEARAKAWATSHVVAAVFIGAAVGFLLGWLLT
jgi:ElaB/YqjD/DUF883 family membrane-anchored ribosome-binding protein